MLDLEGPVSSEAPSDETPRLDEPPLPVPRRFPPWLLSPWSMAGAVILVVALVWLLMGFSPSAGAGGACGGG